MVGREDDIRLLSAELLATRFVTIVGPGRVGKTTVAVAVAHDPSEAFSGAVLFLDLGALADPDTAATSLMALLGISVRSGDPMPSLVAYLHDKHLLLVLDNCEHVIDAAAALGVMTSPDRGCGSRNAGCGAPGSGRRSPAAGCAGRA
jgi:predicted ATPase